MPERGGLVGVLVEGDTDVPAVDAMLSCCGAVRHLKRTIVAIGKDRLDQRLPALNRNARHQSWLVLRDLDRDAGSCARELRRLMIPPDQQAPQLVVRIAVASVEAWLLADAEAFARHFSVPLSKVPRRPDELDDAKSALVNACRSSSSHTVRTGMVPLARSRRRVGLEYVALLGDCCREGWRPEVGADESPSLRRALAEIRDRFGTAATL